jgi:hypothetical protein
MRTTMRRLASIWLKPSRHGIFTHAINAGGRRSGRIIEIEDIDSGEARLASRADWSVAPSLRDSSSTSTPLTRFVRWFRRTDSEWPGTLLSFGCSFRQLSPLLEHSDGQQGASALGIGELGKPIALRRFTQAIFTGLHVLP